MSTFSVLEKLIIPLTLGILLYFANEVSNGIADVSNKIADEQLALSRTVELRLARQSQEFIELQYIEIFFEKIVSKDEEERARALSLLAFLSQDKALPLAQWVQQTDTSEQVRQAAIAVSEKFLGPGYRPVQIDSTYRHDRFGTAPEDLIIEFRAYITSFDSADDDNEDGTADVWGIPHFVAYQINRYEGPELRSSNRPASWRTASKELVTAGIVPTDASYRYSSAFRTNNPNWYVRGHLATKFIAARLGVDAEWNTATVLNAVPQRADFNAGAWLDLEQLTAKWADEAGSVWIVTGPIFEPIPSSPNTWIGEDALGEMKIAVPDSLFKIIARESADPSRPDVLAFIYPQDIARSPSYDHTQFLTTVDSIELKTGLDFFTKLSADAQDDIEAHRADTLWPL